MIWNFKENGRYIVTIWLENGGKSVIGPLTEVYFDDTGVLGGIDGDGCYRFVSPRAVWTMMEVKP